MESGDSNENDGGKEDIFQHCKIVTYSHGRLDFHSENMNRILSRVDKLKFGKDLPTSILAVIGPPKSGKSLLTNFLIECLKAEGDGGWINRSKEFRQGFSWGIVNSPNFLKPNKDTGGIYLWPDPYKITNSEKEKDVMVWVMHMAHVADDEVDLLERFLVTICSRIVEIQWGNREMRLMKHLESLKTLRSPLPMNSCDSAVYVVRSSSKTVESFGEEAARDLVNKMNANGNESAYLKQLQSMQNLHINWVNDLDLQLENDDGTLNIKGFKKIFNSIRKLIETVVNEDDLGVKTFYVEKLTSENMSEAIDIAAKTASDKCFISEDEICGKSERPEVIVFQEEKEGTVDATSAQLFHKGSSQTNSTLEFTTSINSKMNVATKYVSAGEQVLDTMTSITTTQDYRLVTSHPNYINHSQNILDATKIKSTSCNGNVSYSANQITTQQFKDFSCEPMDTEESDILSQTCTTPIPTTTRQLEDISPPKALVKSRVCEADLEPMQIEIDPAIEASNNILSHLKLDCCNRLIQENPTEEVVNENVPKNPDLKRDNAGEILFHAIRNYAGEVCAVRDMMPSTVENTNQPITVTTGQKCSMDVDQVPRNEEKTLQGWEETERKLDLAKHQRKEKGKFEKEAENKRQLAHKKLQEDIMMECAETASSQVYQTLFPSIVLFINERLNLARVNLFGTIYADVFKDVTEGHRRAVAVDLWEKFIHYVDSLSKPKCSVILDQISFAMVNFNMQMKKKFELNGYFQGEKLRQILKDEIEKLMEKESMNLNTTAPLELACQKLTTIYMEHNSLIKDIEMANYNVFKNRIEEHYQDKMIEIMKDAPFSPQKLSKIHEKLVVKLVVALSNACRLQPSVDGDMKPILYSLRETLLKSFRSHQRINETKIKSKQMEVMKVVGKFRTEYNSKCEEIFAKFPDGVDEKTLNKHHSAICLEMKKLLELEIRAKVRKDEPIENYISLLQNHIDSYVSTVLAVNRTNLKRKTDLEEKMRRERGKANARRHIQEKNVELGIDATPSGSTKSLHPSDKRPVLPPLIFHLQSTNIVMGMRDKSQILKNEGGESVTPAFVVLTPENNLLYGSEALALIESDSIPEDLRGGSYWSITNLFLTPEKHLSRVVRIDEMECTVTHEFLLGYIFRKLKDNVEHQMKGQCTRTLIAVPFWLSSTQRLRVKDAAKLAGFSDVYLINEGAAVAYNVALVNKKHCRVLVMTENLNRVDAFVYHFLEFNNRTIMSSHQSNYSKEGRGWIKTMTEYFYKAIAYLRDDAHSENDVIKKNLDDICHETISNAYCRNEVQEALFTCGNERKWGTLMAEVSRKYAKSDKQWDFNGLTAVINGAIALSSDLQNIGALTSDKLISKIERPSTNKTGSVTMIHRHENLPETTKVMVSSLPNSVKERSLEVNLYQEICQANHSIGTLTVKPFTFGYNETLDVELELSNEGIVYCKELRLTRSNCRVKSRVSLEHYCWRPENLSPDQLKTMSQLFNLLVKPQVDPELIQAKESLLQNCIELEEKLSKGKLKVKSELGKDLVRKKIKEAKGFANHEKATLGQLKLYMSIVKQLFEKYDK